MDIVGGIDCGKAYLDIALSPCGARTRVENTEEGFAELTVWLSGHGVSRIGIEASGGYERPVRTHLRSAGMAVHVLDPARVRHFAKAAGQRAKSDPVDAQMIAAYVAAFPTAGATETDATRENLADLIRARRVLVEKRADLTKAARMAGEVAGAALTEVAEHMARLIAELEDKIERDIQATPTLAERAKALQSAPGIGPTVAAMLVVRLPELAHAPGSRVAALVGVAPFNDDSGQRQGYRHIGGGRADVRQLLFLATLAAIRVKGGCIAAFYDRLRAAGKTGKVAVVACMRKLIVRLNAMLAAGQTWQEKPPQ